MADSEQTKPVLGESREAMERALRSLRAELQKTRTGRANPALLENLQVNYYGAPTPLKQLANISVPEAKLMVVAPYDAGCIAEVERAILAADLGLTPNNDGKLVRLPVPPLTEERRHQLVKQIKKTAEEHKIGVRDARRHGISKLKELEGAGALSKDERRRAEKQMQELTDAHVKQIDAATGEKEREILEL